VDDGKILAHTAIYRETKDTVEEVFEKLAFTSLKSWQKFFNNIK